MSIFYTFVHVVEYILFVYLAFGALYIFVFAFAGRFFPPKTTKITARKFRKFAVLIPGYKEDNVIVEVARQAMEQDYQTDLFDVIIIADSFQEETIAVLKKMPIKLIEVSFEKSTKSKALNRAMEVLGDNYDVALVLDADNIMENKFISKMNLAFERGYQVVQGHRVAKNTDSAFAILDAISEELNNHIFRKGHRALGFSSALIGSGMAFDYNMFKNRMLDITAVGGFDKELELTLLRDKIKIEYLDQALVSDEKVQKIEVFENQRKRWLSAQFIYFGRFIFPGITHLLLKANFDFFDKVYQMISPPRVLLIGVTGILMLISVTLNLIFPQNQFLAIPFFYWIITFLTVLISFVLSIPKKFYNYQTLTALLSLPKAFVSMFLSLFKLKGANKQFLHTKHGSN